MEHPEWIVWIGMGLLLLIFGAVAWAYLGNNGRKNSRGYGWWW